MTEKLELIKALRAKGATIRMIDDVAAHLDKHGGYSSPVFVATVEFIIKIRQIIKSVMVDKEQGQDVSVSEKFSDKETENVNFQAAKSGVENDGEVDEYERAQILNHISEIEAIHNNYLENNTYKEFANLNSDPREQKNKKNRANKKGGGIFERLAKLASSNSQRQNQLRRQQMELDDTENQIHAQQAQQAQQISQQNARQAVQAVQRSSVTRMNIMKMKLMTALKIGKDRTVLGDAAWKSKQSAKDNLHGVENHKDEKSQKVQELAGLKANANSQKEKKVLTEVSISKVIDEAVKTNRQNKQVEEKTADKGKFEQKFGDKAGPRSDDKKVAEMAVKDAMAKLRESGMQTTGVNTKSKNEVDQQMVMLQAAGGGGATPKMQR